MWGLRQILAKQCHAFWLLGLLALSVRALVPAGIMPDQDAGGTLSVRICSPANPGLYRTIEIAVPRKGDAGEGNDVAVQDHCAFAALSFAAIATDDALMADRAPLYAVPPQQRGIALKLANAQYWRPPLRAPPHTA